MIIRGISDALYHANATLSDDGYVEAKPYHSPAMGQIVWAIGDRSKHPSLRRKPTLRLCLTEIDYVPDEVGLVTRRERTAAA